MESELLLSQQIGIRDKVLYLDVWSCSLWRISWLFRKSEYCGERYIKIKNLKKKYLEKINK